MALSIQAVVGTSLWGINMAAETLTLQFGTRRQVLSRRSQPIDVGEFSLHIQCPYQFTASGGAVADPKVFLTQRGPLQVLAVKEPSVGSFVLEMSGDAALVVSADAAPDEQWRLFRAGSGEPHLIFGGGLYHGE
jgi:hypothetical protein